MKPSKILATTVLSLAIASPLAIAQSVDPNTRAQTAERTAQEREFTDEVRDAWITGKIETVLLLNTQLNSFRISTDVEDGSVTLGGTVNSDVDKDLAGELAKGVEGVDRVENNITVQSREMAGEGRSDNGNGFAQWVSDATTTAVVKSRLLANDNTSGMDISVETEGDVVTLSGTVESEAEKQLAEQIARNTRNVQDVRNYLEMDQDA